jgi:hypothetical protein
MSREFGYRIVDTDIGAATLTTMAVTEDRYVLRPHTPSKFERKKNTFAHTSMKGFGVLGSSPIPSKSLDMMKIRE